MLVQICMRPIGKCVVMLYEQQMRIGSAVKPPLQFERLDVWNAAEPSDPQWPLVLDQSSAAQSRLSSISVTRSKKPAAYAPSNAR